MLPEDGDGAACAGRAGGAGGEAAGCAGGEAIGCADGDAALGELLWARRPALRRLVFTYGAACTPFPRGTDGLSTRTPVDALPMASASSIARSLLAMLLLAAPMLLALSRGACARAPPEAGRPGRAGPADCDRRRPVAGRPAERCVECGSAAFTFARSHTPTHLAGCEARRSFRASAGALSKSVVVAAVAACLRYTSSAVDAIVSGRLYRAVRLSDAGGTFDRLQTPPCSSPRVDASESRESEPSHVRDAVRENMRPLGTLRVRTPPRVGFGCQTCQENASARCRDEAAPHAAHRFDRASVHRIRGASQPGRGRGGAAAALRHALPLPGA